jgi:hypothetical protein
MNSDPHPNSADPDEGQTVAPEDGGSSLVCLSCGARLDQGSVSLLCPACLLKSSLPEGSSAQCQVYKDPGDAATEPKLLPSGAGRHLFAHFEVENRFS